jgi:DNA-binding LacI/PurR family transcriptional regulator
MEVTKMITAREVAEKVGISISTVGRAMADDPRISAETKAKVRRVADELGYVGNLPARMMRGSSSNLIGLILPDIRNDFYSAIAQALSECCDRQGYRLVLSISGDDREAEHRHIRDLVGARVSGIIIVPMAKPRRESAALLASVPHVQLLRHVPALGSAWFGIDDDAALEAATSHLIKLGHRSIAYIGGSPALSTGAARLRGVKRAFEVAGLAADSLKTVVGPTTLDFGEAALGSLLDGSVPPTAVVSGSVHVTEGILKALRRRAVDIPRQLSVIGFGDPIWFAWWGPGLTTIQPPIGSLATTCGLWFLDQIQNYDGSGTATHQATSPSTLVIRGSTTPPRS